MSNQVTKAIEQAEKQRGKPLSAIERLNISRSIPKEDDTESRMEIILTETMEGIQAVNDFHAEIESANLINNSRMRHIAAHTFEATKRELLAKFNSGLIERIKPVKEAA